MLKYRHRVLGLLCFLAIITYLDRVAISVAGPRVQEELGLNPEMWGWVVGIFSLSYTLFEIPSGRMGDRLGSRRVLTRIVLWWSAFTAFTGIASSYYVLLLTRFLFGAGEAGAFPNIGVTVSRWFPMGERARTMGIVLTFIQLGGAIAPLVIVPIQINYGWRASFYVLGVIGVCWAAVWYWWFRDTPAEKDGVSEAEKEEIGVRSYANNHHLPWRDALKSANLWAIFLAAFCWIFALYFFISWLHTFLSKARGFSEGDLLLSTAPAVLGACGNLSGGFFSDAWCKRFGLKWGRRAVGLIGLSCAALFMVAAMLTANKVLTLLFLGLVYAGITVQQTVFNATLLDISRKYVGGICGAVNMVGNLGGFVFSVSFGYFVTWFGSYDLALIPVAAMLAVASLAWLRIDATEAVIPETEEEPTGLKLTPVMVE